jgi:arylsulfatase A-like enzyme
MRRGERFFGILIAGLVGAITWAEPPNVVLILADDLGYGDTGCYGAEKVLTPNIDRLAAEGIRFTDAYSASPLCCPSRYAILSGVYPWRAHHRADVGIWSTHRTPSLFSLYGPPGDQTLAAVLQTAGYATGAVGKWHLGLTNAEQDWNRPLRPGPLESGFDYFFGDASNRYKFYIDGHFVARVNDDRTPIEGFDASLVIPDSVWKIDPPKNAGVLAGKACSFIREHAGEKPFFLYYCPNNVHTPLSPGAGFQGSSQAGVYGDFIQELDATVGDVIRTLEETGELDNTLVIFSSDNGGRLDLESRSMGHLSNGALLGQKSDVWEGGIRVPLIFRFPALIPAGRVSGQLVSLVDLLPTLADLTGRKIPEGRHLDGLVLTDVLKGSPASAELAGRTLAANIGNRAERMAVRQGDWVYINGQGSGGVSAGESSLASHRKMYNSYEELEFVNSDINPDGSVKDGAPPDQLYNLKDDPSEKMNVIAAFPEKAAEMRTMLKTLNQRVILK